MTKSILDEVEGIGEVRKKEIWKHFKSLKRLKEATIEEIRQVVPEKVAQNIYNIRIIQTKNRKMHKIKVGRNVRG